MLTLKHYPRLIDSSFRNVWMLLFESPHVPSEQFIQLLLNSQSQSLHNLNIRCRVAILLVDHRKAARVVPHCPPNAVLFHRRAHIPDPNGAISRGCKLAEGPELVTSKRDVILCGPGGSHPNLAVNAGGIPIVFAIAKQIVTRRFILNRVENLAHAF